MGLEIGIGFSQHESVIRAAEEAAEQAKNMMNASRIDLAIVLTTPHYSPQEVHPIVEKVLNHTRIIGGTTLGIILSEGLKHRGIAIFTFYSEAIKLKPIHLQHLHLKNLEESGKLFLKESGDMFGIKDRKFMMFFFDGLLENMSQFINGITSEEGEFFPIWGGGCSDRLLFSKTYQYHDQAPSSSSACGVVFGGDVSLFMTRKHGFKALGKPRMVKKTRDNIIEIIGSSPAIHLYEEFFQDNLGSLKNDVFGKLNARYPLGFFVKTKQEYVIQNVMDILEDGSFACQDSIKEGSEVHIMIGNKHSCLRSAEEAALELKKYLDRKRPSVLFIFESASRWQILKHSWNEELKIITDILGKDFPIIGMLTYGEIFNPGMLNFSGKKNLLNGNIILSAII